MDEIDRSACQRVVVSLRRIESRAVENERYFTGPNKLDVVDQTFREAFSSLHTLIRTGVVPVVESLFQVAARYDADVAIRANGIRSWLSCVERLANELNHLCTFIESKRDSVFFRRVSIARKLVSLLDYLAAVRQCLDVVEAYTEVSPNSLLVEGFLDPTIDIDEELDIVSDMRSINMRAFRGKTSCFHFNESVAHIGHGVLLGFAAYCQAFKLKHCPEKQDTTPACTDSPLCRSPVTPDSGKESCDSTSSSPGSDGDGPLLTMTPLTGKCASPNVSVHPRNRILSFVTDSDVLADDVMWGYANLDLANMQQFWNFADNPLVLAGMDFLLPAVALSQGMNLFSVPLVVQTRKGNGSTVVLEPPENSSGMSPTKARLISDVLRAGQEYWLQEDVPHSQLKPVSDVIVFQVHGGGFICQSSRAQEVYLREFCLVSKAPFFCVDYSLLPDAIYPKAIEETVFAYCWMLENMAKLGWNGKRIVCFGDSAGCCLLLSMCVRLIELNIRVPDSMLFVYPYACASFCPGPSRLLAHADPIVPIPLLLRCSFGYSRLAEKDIRIALGIDEMGESAAKASPYLRTSVIPLPQVQKLRQCKSASGLLCGQPPTQRDQFIASNQKPATPGSSLQFGFSKRPFTPSEREAMGAMLTMPVLGEQLFSPILASDAVLAQMPFIQIVATTADPLLDDSVVLCKRMRKAGARCEMEVVDGLPHGFLNMAIVSSVCRAGSALVQRLFVDLVANN